MKPLLYLIFLIFVLCVSCKPNPCQTKDSFLTSYDTFISDVEEHAESLAEADWKDINEEYKQFIDVCYEQHKEEMNISEKVDFWKNTLSYSTYHTGDREELETIMDDIQVKLEEDLKNFTAESREEIEDYFRKEIAPELESAIDEILEGVEEFGEKMKDWLKDLEDK